MTRRAQSSSQPPPSSQSQSSQVARRRASPHQKRQSALALPAEEHIRWSELTKAQKVVYATRQTSYAAWIVIGLGVTGKSLIYDLKKLAPTDLYL